MDFDSLKKAFNRFARKAEAHAAVFIESAKSTLAETFLPNRKDWLMKNFPASFGSAIRKGDVLSLTRQLRKDPLLAQPRGARVIDSPAHMTVLHGKPEILKYLKMSGADMNRRVITTPDPLMNEPVNPAGETVLELAQRHLRFTEALDLQDQSSVEYRGNIRGCIQLLQTWASTPAPRRVTRPGVH